MGNVTKERKNFTEILKENISFYDKFWTKTFPDENFRVYSNFEGKTKKIYCFGCEQTLAQDLLDEQTWPYLLAKQLGDEWKAFNFGKQNASLQEICRIFYQIITVTKPEDYPDAVFFLFPEILRTEYIGNIDTEPVKYSLVFNSIYTDELAAKIHTKYSSYTSLLDAFYYNLKFFNIIKLACNNRGIKWYWYSHSNDYQELEAIALNKYMETYNTILNEKGKLSILSENRRDLMQNIAKEFAKLHSNI